MPEDMARPESAADAAARVVIKKYANRRLYNTAASTYVTLDHLAEMVRRGQDFVVFDARTNDDITRQVLTQIIFEEETRGQNLLPIQFLRQLIRLYGDQMQGLVPSYLEMSLDAFAKGQEGFREQALKAVGAAAGANPAVKLFEDQVKSNMALFSDAMRLWAPGIAAAVVRPPPSSPSTAPAPAKADELGDLKRQMQAMQAQLAKLAEKG